MTAIEFAGPLPSSPVATLTQVRGWARGVFDTGVYPTGTGLYAGGFACSDGGGLNVSVAAGEALVDGVYATSSGAKTVTLATADVSNPRIDLIVLRLDPTANGGDGAVTLEAKTGTPAGSPVAPTVTQSASGTWETALATVAVAASSAVLGAITDVRTFVAKGNSFLALGDTPSAYVAGRTVSVNAAGTALEFGLLPPVLRKVKTASESVTTSTTLQDDDHLSVSLESGKTYLVQVMLAVSPGAGAFKFTVAFTGTSSLARFGYAAVVFGTASAGQVDVTFGTASASTGTSDQFVTVSAVVTTTSAGTCKLQWAQNASDAAATTVLRGSSMTVAEV